MKVVFFYFPLFSPVIASRISGEAIKIHAAKLRGRFLICTSKNTSSPPVKIPVGFLIYAKI